MKSTVILYRQSICELGQVIARLEIFLASIRESGGFRVNEKGVPKHDELKMYSTVSAVGSLLTAVTGLLTSFVISQALSIFAKSLHGSNTPSRRRVAGRKDYTPRLFRQFQAADQQTGQVVLFQPPQPLRNIVARSGGSFTKRDLFVKRIAALGASTKTPKNIR